MTTLLEGVERCFAGCGVCTPPELSQSMFPGLDLYLVGKSIIASNHQNLLRGLYHTKEDPWVNRDITQHSFPIQPGILVYFWVGYLTARSCEDVDLEIFRERIDPERKEGWRFGGIEHLFLIGRFLPEEVLEGSAIIGLREPGEVRGISCWPRLVHGDGSSLVPYGENKVTPATRVLIVHEKRV